MITKNELEHIATLSKLFIAEDEMDKYATAVDEMIQFADCVCKAQCSDEIIDVNAENFKLMRDDRVEDSLPCEEILSNTVHKDKSFLKISKRA